MELADQEYRDGDKVYSIPRLFMLASVLKPFKIPLKHLNVVDLYPEIKSTKSMVYHIGKVNDADLSYPIILDEEGFVMDGRHRVLKALATKEKDILAVRFDVTPNECYLKVNK